MKSVAILAVVIIATLIGDYCIKLASQKDSGLTSPLFLIGAILYGLPAIGWLVLMRDHSLAAVGVFYSAATILTLTLLGVFVFREQFGIREAAGVTLAIASVFLMNH